MARMQGYIVQLYELISPYTMLTKEVMQVGQCELLLCHLFPSKGLGESKPLLKMNYYLNITILSDKALTGDMIRF